MMVQAHFGNFCCLNIGTDRHNLYVHCASQKAQECLCHFLSCTHSSYVGSVTEGQHTLILSTKIYRSSNMETGMSTIPHLLTLSLCLVSTERGSFSQFLVLIANRTKRSSSEHGPAPSPTHTLSAGRGSH